MSGISPISRRAIFIVVLLIIQGCTVRDVVFTRRQTPVNIPVLLNDKFKASDLADVVSVTTPGHGTATLNANDTVTYTPAVGYVGVDRFTYTVVKTGGKSYTEEVVVTVRPPYNHYGCNFSPYIDGQNPRTGGTVTLEQLTARIEKVAPYCEWIRFFGLAEDMYPGPSIAKNLGMKVAAGAWIEGDEAANQAELARLIQVAPYSDVLIVGSEVLLRNDVTVWKLIEYINQVKAANTGKPVTTSEDDLRLRANPELVDAVDIVYTHIYPWWDGLSFEQSTYHLFRDFLYIQFLAGTKEVVAAETGWKSSGSSNGSAIASLVNAVAYHVNFASLVRATGMKAFIFGAFDEPWKGEDDDGWGIWNSNLQMKSGMESVFEGASAALNVGTDPVEGPGTPTLQLTHVPPRIEGSTDDTLTGRVLHVAPLDTGVIVYINVPDNNNVSHWYIKPYAFNRISLLNLDGTFSTDIYTGGADESGTQVAVFVVPRGYSPPPLPYHLNSTLPAELYSVSLANTIVTR